MKSLLSPKKFFFISCSIQPWLVSLFFILLGYGLIGGLCLAPSDYQQGDGFRIIYVHAPSAFLSLLIYSAMGTAAALGIIFRLKLAFLVIKESVVMGAGFTLLALITGSLWGKPMWGTWWIWDARLTSELILFFLYIGIILFQSAIVHKKNADKIIAILVLFGWIDIPIIHYSVYFWNTLHQGATLTLFSPPAIDSSMLYPLLSMITAFVIYYILILSYRMRYALICAGHHHWMP